MYKCCWIKCCFALAWFSMQDHLYQYASPNDLMTNDCILTEEMLSCDKTLLYIHIARWIWISRWQTYWNITILFFTDLLYHDFKRDRFYPCFYHTENQSLFYRLKQVMGSFSKTPNILWCSKNQLPIVKLSLLLYFCRPFNMIT